MLKLLDKGFRSAIISMYREVKENKPQTHKISLSTGTQHFIILNIPANKHSSSKRIREHIITILPTEVKKTPFNNIKHQNNHKISIT